MGLSDAVPSDLAWTVGDSGRRLSLERTPRPPDAAAWVGVETLELDVPARLTNGQRAAGGRRPGARDRGRLRRPVARGGHARGRPGGRPARPGAGAVAGAAGLANARPERRSVARDGARGRRRDAAVFRRSRPDRGAPIG